MPSDPVHVARARLASAVRLHGRGSTESVDTKRDLAAAKLEREVRRVIADAPPLTDHQTQSIVALLTGGAA